MEKLMATKQVKHIADLFAKTVSLELKDFDGNLTGLTIKVVGIDSKQFRDAEKKTLPYFNKTKGDLSPEDLAALTEINKDMVISLIVGWENDDAFGGEFTPELARSIFEQEHAKVVLDQVEAFAKERANFFRTSKK